MSTPEEWKTEQKGGRFVAALSVFICGVMVVLFSLGVLGYIIKFFIAAWKW